MKVVNSNTKNLVEIKSLLIGDTFRNPNCTIPNEIYQRVEVSAIYIMNLRTGRPAFFNTSDMVIPVTTTLTWEDE